jgi:hypothetical protein
MKRTVLATAAAVAAIGLAIPLSATAHHKPGHEGGDTTSLITIAAEPEPVLWGDNTVISGRLKGPDNGGVAVDLQQDPYPYGSEYNAEILARATTNAQGYYTFTIAPGQNTNYRAIARTDPPRMSQNLKVHSQMRINRRVTDRTPKRGQIVTFYGAVVPAHDGRTVYIQRRGSDGAFHTLARTKLTDAGDEFPTNSFYERDVRIRRGGVFRVQVRKDANHVGNESGTVRLRTH